MLMKPNFRIAVRATNYVYYPIIPGHGKVWIAGVLFPSSFRLPIHTQHFWSLLLFTAEITDSERLPWPSDDNRELWRVTCREAINPEKRSASFGLLEMCRWSWGHGDDVERRGSPGYWGSLLSCAGFGEYRQAKVTEITSERKRVTCP